MAFCSVSKQNCTSIVIDTRHANTRRQSQSMTKASPNNSPSFTGISLQVFYEIEIEHPQYLTVIVKNHINSVS
jgi:hypothetical protein